MRFPEVGESFAGKYRIDAMLGSGGFSRVYRATQLDLDRQVAIKILQPPVTITSVNAVEERDEKLRALMSRFEREARMVSKLKSPHTITMYDYGQTDDGQLYMSLEFVDGLTLTDLLVRDGALAPDRVSKIMRQVLMSLYEAHQYGMLHRDIKPQNIMVYEHFGMTDQVKLLDFGIVKLIGREAQKDVTDLTSDDTLVGTPRYMSPEYIRGEDIIQASDIYSLGLVMYELLVGEQAIQANSSIQIIGQQLERESFYLPQNLGHIDPALRAIINGMVEKNTSMRYTSTKQIIEDLEARDRDPNTIPPNAPKLFAAPALGIEPTDRLPGARRQIRSEETAHIASPSPDFYDDEVNKGGNKGMVALLGVGMLAVIAMVGLLGAMALSESSPAQSEPKPDVEASLAKTTESQTTPAAEKPAEVAAVQAAETFTISSTPDGAMLVINSKPHGKTPASLSSKDIAFPANIEVEHEGRKATAKLDAPEDLELELPEVVAKEKEEKKPSRDSRSPKKSTRKETRKVAKTETRETTRAKEEKPAEVKKTSPTEPKQKGLGLKGLPTLDP
jgi:serine/threonine protein kinase